MSVKPKTFASEEERSAYIVDSLIERASLDLEDIPHHVIRDYVKEEIRLGHVTVDVVDGRWRIIWHKSDNH